MKVIVEDFWYKGKHYDSFAFEEQREDLSDAEITRDLCVALDEMAAAPA